jgi:small subunit ribosomal protein S4e
VKPTPGPHSSIKCIPLAIVLRDILGFANTRKEAKTIVAQGKIQVDGKIRRNDDFPIGVMDVISMPDAGKAFCVLPHYRGLQLNQIGPEESNFKLCRIEDKTTLKKGQVQMRLHDGSNMAMKVADPKNPQEDSYQTLDTLKISLPEKKILQHMKMKEKDFVVIIGGKNVGKFGKIVEIEKAEGKKRRNSLVTIEDENSNRYQTTLEFVFAIGEAKPLISLPEAA